MFQSIRSRFRAWKSYKQTSHFLSLADQYERDASQHRSLIRFHQEAEMHCRTLSKAAKMVAGRIA